MCTITEPKIAYYQLVVVAVFDTTNERTGLPVVAKQKKKHHLRDLDGCW